MRRPFAYVLIACALAAAPAGASNFWEQSGAAKPAAGDSKDETSFDELVAKADEYAELSERYRAMWWRAYVNQQLMAQREFMEEAREAAKPAIRYYDKALELRPDDADLHYRCGRLTYTYLYEYYDEYGPRSRRDEAGKHAVEHWDAFERLAPDDPRRVEFIRWASPGWAQPSFFDPASYQFSRSIYYTKLGTEAGYEKALEDYDYLLDVAPRADRNSWWIAQLLTNSAEIHMALGHVEEAIDRYREGLEYGTEPLYYFGLAVALDRDGERQSALEHMSKALALDPGMENLNKKGVFFIPDGDISYYYGLAYEAQGNTAKALKYFRDYADRIKDTRYIEHARDHIEKLEKRAKEKKQRK